MRRAVTNARRDAVDDACTNAGCRGIGSASFERASVLLAPWALLTSGLAWFGGGRWQCWRSGPSPNGGGLALDGGRRRRLAGAGGAGRWSVARAIAPCVEGPLIARSEFQQAARRRCAYASGRCPVRSQVRGGARRRPLFNPRPRATPYAESPLHAVLPSSVVGHPERASAAPRRTRTIQRANAGASMPGATTAALMAVVMRGMTAVRTAGPTAVPAAPRRRTARRPRARASSAPAMRAYAVSSRRPRERPSMPRPLATASARSATAPGRWRPSTTTPTSSSTTRDCTNDVCTNGVPSNPGKAAGTACGAGSALKCDGAGACVSVA